jgi:hypothetical protein
MDKEELKRMGKNPNFIDGIYNYCDRWCKRCTHTSKCMLYAMEQKQFDEPEKRDINNEEFWEEIASSFQLAFELLEDAAEDMGIDLKNIDLEDTEDIEDRRERAEKHPLAVMTKEYGKEVNEWFEKSEPEFESRGVQLYQKAEMGIPEEDITEEVDHLKNLVEIVRWYQHQIWVKSMRALQGKFDEFEIDPIQNDYNGSAKVVFIGVSRSTAAWTGLYEEFPSLEDETLSILARLEKVKSILEETFPDLHEFVRPGFDE